MASGKSGASKKLVIKNFKGKINVSDGAQPVCVSASASAPVHLSNKQTDDLTFVCCVSGFICQIIHGVCVCVFY